MPTRYKNYREGIFTNKGLEDLVLCVSDAHERIL